MKNGKYCSSKKVMKPLAVLLAMILLVGCAVGGTLAWLTAKTTEVKNTFTSAKLFADPNNEFTLWEHEASDADNNGQYELSDTTKAVDGKNEYDILPGVSIPKDPTVTVKNLQEDGYLYIKITTDTLPEGLTYALDTCWTAVADGSNVYYYSNNGSSVIKAFASGAADMNVNIIKDKTISVDTDYEPAEDATEPYILAFEAYMVQATGNGENAADAWANTYGATTNP